MNDTEDIKRYLPLLILFTLILLSLPAGCDNSIDPLDETKSLYSIYGQLGIFRETNYIRVKNLKKPLLADSTRELNVAVTLENLDTGQTEILQDSVVRFHSVYTHNFVVTMDIKPDMRYRVTIEGPGAKTLTKTTYAPQIVETKVALGRRIFYPVKINETLRYTFLGSNDDTTGTYIVPFVGAKFGYCAAVPLRNDKGEYLNAKTIPLGGPVVKIQHYSSDAFVEILSSDSLSIPGGVGYFGGYYFKTFKVGE